MNCIQFMVNDNKNQQNHILKICSPAVHKMKIYEHNAFKTTTLDGWICGTARNHRALNHNDNESKLQSKNM